MKKLVLNLFSIAALGVSTTMMAASTDSQAKDLSYALGYQAGSMVHFAQAKLDHDTYEDGLNTGLSGKASSLTPGQIQQILTNFQMQLQQKGQEMMQAQSAANAQASEKFLADNKNNKDVVTLKDGLQYKVLEAGKGAMPTLKDAVTVDYEGKLINGNVFDSSYKRGTPATFPVSGVIAGWTQALQLMPVGSTWELYIPADLAYGSHGVPGIGPNQALIFKVHLIKIK